MNMILLVILVSLLAGSVVYYFIKSGNMEEAYKHCFEEMVRIAEEKGKLESDYEYLKKTINHTVNTLLTRPIMANLTDQQIQHLAEVLSQYMTAMTKKPADLN